MILLYPLAGRQFSVSRYCSTDLPVARAIQPKLAANNDSFVAQICDPWLGSYPSASFHYSPGGDLPAAQTIEVYSGCKQSFEVTGFTVDQPWLNAIPDSKSVGMKVRLEVNVDGLAPGTYEAKIRVTVPAAYLPTLEIPVVVVVEE